MAALDLHHALFTNEKDSDLPLRSAAGFLQPAPERDGSPTSHLFASSAYQDLIQRQPTHPDGPRSGWDLGLNLLGDPVTAAERKILQDRKTKMRIRRLHAVNVAFEVLFGVWGTYTTVRYFLAYADSSGGPESVCTLVLGIISALAVALVIASVVMPLLPHHSHPRAWRFTRSLLRACYLLFLFAPTATNIVLVLMWHPSQLCDWDLDISWYTSAANTVTSPCRAAPFAAWITAAILRLVVTLTMALTFIYTLRSFYGTRHPKPEGNSHKYSPYFPSDPEYASPVSTSSPLRISKSTFRFARSEDSSHTLNQSHVTLPKSNSISTLAPSTSCTGHSRSHSNPSCKDVPPPRISPPTSRRPSTSTHATTHGSSPTQSVADTPSQMQLVGVVTATSSTPPHMLRRTNHISLIQVASDAPDIPSCPERFSDPTETRESSEIRSCASWKPSHRGTTAHLDVRKATPAWENAHVRHAARNAGPESFSSTCDDGESVREKERHDSDLVYSYGYGASGPAYPYLDMHNPRQPGEYAETSSSREDVDERGLSQGYRSTIPSGPAFPDVSSEPRSSLSMEEMEEEEESSGVGEEYVAMMGRFVRRMATIESLGSREAAGTLSTKSSSVARRSMRSTPASQFSSVRFAETGSSGTSSLLGVPLGTEGSLSTAYLSFSSGGTGMRVNERGELLPGHDGGGAAGSSYDRHYYTASNGSGLPGDEGR